MAKPVFDRVMAPDYVDGLPELSIDEVRVRRGDCQELEVGFSYLRRLVQGRLDIVLAEFERRGAGEARSDAGAIVDNLSGILGERVRAPGLGRLPTLLVPSDDVGESLLAELDAVADAGRLGRLAELDDEALRTLADDLGALERSVSDRRRALHERIDALQEEIVRRYRTGEATVETLLR